MRANRSAFGFEPADLAKGRLGFRIRHPQHIDKTEGLGFAGEEEVLAHLSRIRCLRILYVTC